MSSVCDSTAVEGDSAASAPSSCDEGFYQQITSFDWSVPRDRHGNVVSHDSKLRVYPPCRACNRRPGRRNKTLCSRCYADRAIREAYPSISKYGRRSDIGAPGVRPLPEPTDALPGTEAKVRVLIQRAALGLELWHPRDAVRDDRPIEQPRPASAVPLFG